MIVVYQNELDEWVRLEGGPVVINDVSVSPPNVQKMVDLGVWDESDLDPLGLRLAIPVESVEGKVLTGPSWFEEVEGELFERRTLEDLPEPDERRKINTYTIVKRVIEAGKAAQANALLDTNPDLKFRFLTVEKVWNDDPPMLAALEALELDPEVILAPEF